MGTGFPVRIIIRTLHHFIRTFRSTGGEGAPMVYANEATVDWNNLILSEDFLNLLNEDPKDVRHCLTKESVIENNTGLPAAAMHEKSILPSSPARPEMIPKLITFASSAFLKSI